MNRPETDRFLSSLKDFQRDTVDYVFALMYEHPSPAMRFLIADEVGLGKTKVAAGIVARAVDTLGIENAEQRIDVIYICSNAAIARQNINRLNVTGQPCHDLPDRITLLPRDMNRLQKNPVNFIAFTPGTSLSVRSSGGKAEERALLYRLLPDEWITNKDGTISLLRGEMARDHFKRLVQQAQQYWVDDKTKQEFRARLRAEDTAGADPSGSLKERFVALADQLGRHQRLSDEERQKRNEIVGTLRGTLAAVCIDSLKPNLIILDEFQRFSDLLHGTDDASQLAQQLFHYRDVRVLLLSATPYRMFTTADEPSANGHYADLIQTVRFLQDDSERTQAFQSALSAYGRELYRIGTDDGSALRCARDEIVSILRRVMVRTERLAVTPNRGGMLKEVVCPDVLVMDHDIDSFLALQSLARSLDVPDVTEYWKSASYLVNFMDEYDLKRDFVDLVQGGSVPAEIFRALSANSGTLLSKADVSAYCQLDPGNARLRNLMHDMLDSEVWRMLWIPPSWRYYESEGEFAAPISQTLTKRLIFSSWHVVPKVVSALITHEAERRMLGIGPEGEPDSQGPEARKKRRGLLRFSRSSEGRLTGMPVLGLMYPSFVLAIEADPRRWAPADIASPIPKLNEILERTRDICSNLLSEITTGAPVDGDVDETWYWAAPILLDLNRDAASEKAWFGQANLAARWRGADVAAADDDVDEVLDDDAWAAHVGIARDMANGSPLPGRPPADLADVLALNAVAGPAVAALRALARVGGGLQRVTDKSLRNRAGQVAEAFRSLFNQPEVMVMLRRANNEEPYWQRVLEYCARGGLQAVLDEYAHVLVEHLGVSGRPSDQIEREVSSTMRDALTLRTATVAADSVDVNEAEKRISIGEKLRFRTRFAVRYGGRAQEETATIQRASDVQNAFNSPFWPFVLCSTSVGQEGLDFHLYCHAVMHWNLPSNPVDLEQREGRIHRYKGHAVRKNVARDYSTRATYRTSGVECDSWRELFEAARSARIGEASDLVPFWVYTTDGGAHIERHMPMIPLSKDVDRAEALRRSLTVYRMAFGQNRQDDLVQYLQRYLTQEQIAWALRELRIDLTPEQSPERHKSGVLQVPGELIGDEMLAPGGAWNFGLADLEDLLDTFVALRPAVKVVSAKTLEALIDEFVALRNN